MAADGSSDSKPSLGEIMSLLCGFPPTADNTAQVLERRYCFGDSLLPMKDKWLPSQDDVDDTLTFYLGLAPTKQMNEVTQALLLRKQPSCDDADRQREVGIPSNIRRPMDESMETSLRTPLTPGTPSSDFTPRFSVAEYDVVQYVARECALAMKRCGASLHHATHTGAKAVVASSLSTAAKRPSADVTAVRLVMPEELLGS